MEQEKIPSKEGENRNLSFREKLLNNEGMQSEIQRIFDRVEGGLNIADSITDPAAQSEIRKAIEEYADIDFLSTKEKNSALQKAIDTVNRLVDEAWEKSHPSR